MVSAMLRKLVIDNEGERVLNDRQNRQLLSAAYGRSQSPQVRTQLALVCLLEDDFPAVIALFAEADPADVSVNDLLLLCQARLSMEQPDSDEKVIHLAEHALARPGSPNQNAEALALKGKALVRLSDPAAARADFMRALQLEPGHMDACKRLIALDLADGEANAVLTLTDSLMQQGQSHPRLLAGRALAQAQVSDLAAAQQTFGLDQFLLADTLPTPPGYSDLASFNAAVAAELLSHPAMRYERYGSASELSWRVENPLRADRPAIRTLVDSIIASIQDRVSALDPDQHPWATDCPNRAWLRSWSVITESEGYESWHVHQQGWLSGVYYVQVPEAIVRGNGDAGCIAFGLPDDLVGEAAAQEFGQRLIRPEPGLLLTFPSHAYHRTFPHGGREKRICFAFDLRPLADAPVYLSGATDSAIDAAPAKAAAAVSAMAG